MARIKDKPIWLKCKTYGQIRYAKGKYYKFILVDIDGMPVKVAFECKEDGSLTEDSLEKLKKIKDEGKLF